MRFTRIVQGMPSVVPFVGPETQERARGRKFRARLGANESVFGPSPRAVEAMRRAAAEAWKYCDPENHDLKQALASFHGVGQQHIVVGEGIDGLLGCAVRLKARSACRASQARLEPAADAGSAEVPLGRPLEGAARLQRFGFPPMA